MLSLFNINKKIVKNQFVASFEGIIYMSSRSQLASWQALSESAKKMKQIHLKDLFAKDSTRFEQFSGSIPGVLFDYSKQQIDKTVFEQLIALAKECGDQRMARQDVQW